MIKKTDIKVLGIFLFALSIFFIVGGFVGFFYQLKHSTEYAMIIDVASDYIEFNLYKWENSDTIKKTASVKKVSTHVCELNANNPDIDILEFKTSLFDCILRLAEEIDSFEVDNATIFVYGTDFTRIFCAKHIDVCQQIFWTVRDTVESFNMNVDPANSRPLTENEEPLFGWIGVNDFFHTLDIPDQKKYNTVDIKNHTVSVAIYDNGTMVPPKESVMSLKPIVIYGKKFNVYTQDYTCYGTQQVYIRLLLDLIRNQRSINIIHPCMTSIDIHKIKTATMWSSCNPLPTDIPFFESYTIIGKYDEKLCTLAVTFALSSISLSAPHNIMDLQIAIASSPHLFYGFSHVTLQSEWLHLKKGDTLKDFKDAFHSVCGVTNTINPLRERCFNVTYTYVLFTEGLGINPTKVRIGHIKESVETLSGAMVYNSINIPVRKKGSFFGPVGFASLLFTAFTFLTFFVLLLLRCKSIINRSGSHKKETKKTTEIVPSSDSKT